MRKPFYTLRTILPAKRYRIVAMVTIRAQGGLLTDPRRTLLSAVEALAEQVTTT